MFILISVCGVIGGGGFFLIAVNNKKRIINDIIKNNLDYINLKFENNGSKIIKT